MKLKSVLLGTLILGLAVDASAKSAGFTNLLTCLGGLDSSFGTSGKAPEAMVGEYDFKDQKATFLYINRDGAREIVGEKQDGRIKVAAQLANGQTLLKSYYINKSEANGLLFTQSSIDSGVKPYPATDLKLASAIAVAGKMVLNTVQKKQQTQNDLKNIDTLMRLESEDQLNHDDHPKNLGYINIDRVKKKQEEVNVRIRKLDACDEIEGDVSPKMDDATFASLREAYKIENETLLKLKARLAQLEKEAPKAKAGVPVDSTSKVKGGSKKAE